MKYYLYDTEKTKEMRKFINKLCKKAFFEDNSGDVKHLSFLEGPLIMNVFVWDRKILIQDSPLKTTINNLEQIYSLKSEVEFDSLKALLNEDEFESYLKDLFLFN